MKRGKYGKHIFEIQDIMFLRLNYMRMTNQELANALGVTLTVCRNKMKQHGLVRMKLEAWTKDQEQFLLDNYKEIGNVEMARILQETSPKAKGWDKRHISKKMGYLNISRTPAEIEAIVSENIRKGRHITSNKKVSILTRAEHRLFEKQNKVAKQLGYTCIAEAIFAMGEDKFKTKLYEKLESA